MVWRVSGINDVSKRLCNGRASWQMSCCGGCTAQSCVEIVSFASYPGSGLALTRDLAVDASARSPTAALRTSNRENERRVGIETGNLT